MASLDEQLFAAAERGDAAAVEAALAAGADPNTTRAIVNLTALFAACVGGNLACVQALLAAGANPDAADAHGWTPLHITALSGRLQCVAALLAAGAGPLAAAGQPGWTALHCAVDASDLESSEAIALHLLANAPHLARLSNSCGLLPLDGALRRRRFNLALLLLERGALPPASKLLADLEEHTPVPSYLYVPLVARQPLTPAEWKRVPSPCDGLGAALPAVLARSEAEAALLVSHLPAKACERLRTAALCIKRAERRWRVSLPAELLRPLLAAAVAAPEGAEEAEESDESEEYDSGDASD